MTQELVQILLAAKLVVGGLALEAPAPSASRPEGSKVIAYEVLDAQCPPVADFGERGDGQGSGNSVC